MRLLQHHGADQFSLTEDLNGADIPKYAMLSHTWGKDTEEVTFEDMRNGTGKGKLGNNKIRFCGEHARQDGLRYFHIVSPASLSLAQNLHIHTGFSLFFF